MTFQRWSVFFTGVFILAGLVGRVPLLFHGYGSDDDAWRNALAALRMHEVGRYVPSRIPGFPVYEAALFLLQPLGWVATNALSIVAGCLAAYLLHCIARRLGIAKSGWVGVSFFVSAPLWVDTSQTMDYALGLMCFLLAYYALLTARLTVSSILLAVAAGCRISFAFMLGPVVLFLLLQRKPLATVARYVAVFGLCSLIIYSPMLLSPDAQILGKELKGHVARKHAHVREIPSLARAVSVYLFTKLGLLVLAVGMAFELARRVVVARRSGRQRDGHGFQSGENTVRASLFFELSCILLFILFFLLVPYESLYVLPALPLGLLLLARLLRSTVFVALSLATTLSLMVTPYVAVRQLAPGRLFEELRLRKALVQRTEAIASVQAAVATVYLVPRVDIHRLVLLDRDLTTTDTAWAPFRATGVALWSADSQRGFASDLSEAERRDLTARGYELVSWPPQ